jgi:uncharacterized lipoprotein YddW (UPF0748 family)
MKIKFTTKNWRRSLKKLLPIFFLVSFVFALLAQSFPPVTAQQPRQEIRGVWMTINDIDVLRDSDRLQEAIGELARLNFNTIYPVVWNSGYATYPSAVTQQMGIQPFVYQGLQGQDILADLVAQAHRQGLLVIPWFEFGFMTPPSSELALKQPKWITQKRDGTQTWNSAAGEVVSLNPFHPQVQQFISSLVSEIVTRYDVDGIQFDDHMSLPNELGYDKYTTDLYVKETKKKPHSDPQNPAWLKWRADKISKFMVSLNKLVKTENPNAIFSVAPNPYDSAYRKYLQDWRSWVKQGIVDELIVQVYRSDLSSFISKISQVEMREALQKIPTGVGILAGLRNRPVSMQQIQPQVVATHERGMGVCFFFYESLWEYAPEPITERQSSLQALFPYPAPRIASR